MRLILAALLAVFAISASATDREKIPPAPTFNPSSTSSSSATANPNTYAPSAADMAFYALPSTSLAGGALSSATCATSSYTHRSYLWGIYASADGQAKPDPECMALVHRLREVQAAPAVAPQVHIVTMPATQAPVQPAAACPVPAKQKTVAAAKAAGGCKQ